MAVITDFDLMLRVRLPDLPDHFLMIGQVYNMLSFSVNFEYTLFKGSLPANRTLQFCQLLGSVARAEDYPKDNPQRWYWYERRLLVWDNLCVTVEMEAGRIARYALLEDAQAVEPMVAGYVPVEYARFLARSLKTLRTYHLLGAKD